MTGAIALLTALLTLAFGALLGLATGADSVAEWTTITQFGAAFGASLGVFLSSLRRGGGRG